MKEENKVPEPEYIYIDGDESFSFEYILDTKRDKLYPKLLEIIRYCKENNVSKTPFLEVTVKDEVMVFNMEEPYDEQIRLTMEYYAEIEEYEICQELKSYL